MSQQMAVTDDRLERALVLARGGRAAEIRRDLSGALARYSEARTLIDELAPTPLHANLLRWSGSVLRDLGEIDNADRLYSDSYVVADRTGAKAAMAANSIADPASTTIGPHATFMRGWHTQPSSIV